MHEDDVEIQQLKDRLAEAEARRADRVRVEDPALLTKARPKSKKSGHILLAAGAAVVVAMLVIAAYGSKTAPAPAPAPEPYAWKGPTPAEAAAAEAADAPPASRWVYHSEQDPMTDRATRFACTVSTNQVQQNWPYQATPVRLCIRSSPKFGLDVYATLLGDGQIICRSYSQCTTKIRFADRAQQTFSAADAADGSSNVIFVTNAARFVEGVKTANVTRMELTIYQAGTQVIEFPTHGLEWPRPSLAD